MSEPTTTTRTIKIPGPDHPITIERNPKRVVVSIDGRVLADSRDALILREAGYPAVQYIPRKDADRLRRLFQECKSAPAFIV
jgi:uncharacterized protein (DUF427 family)